MQTTKRPRFDWSGLLLLAAGLALTGAFLYPVFGNKGDARPVSIVDATPTDSANASWNYQKIENICVGDRVAIAENPTQPFDDSLGTEVDAESWRQIELRIEDETADVVLLRPKWWLDERLVEAGKKLHLSVPEVGIKGDALVVAVNSCPPIEPGDGRVVIGTFAHWANETIKLHITGLEKPIGCTPHHATWSEDRQKFLKAEDLRPGERVRTVKGYQHVEKIVHVRRPVRVYNLEIIGQHVYQVSNLGVLVHNTGAAGSAPFEEPLVNRPGNLRGDQLPAGPNSPHEVDRRRSQRRREIGLDPNVNEEIPDMLPGPNGGWDRPAPPPPPPPPPKSHKPRHGPGERGDDATPIPPTRR